MSRTNLSSQFTKEEIKTTGAKIIARNTFRRTLPNGDTVVRLHATDIVTKHKDGSVTLNSGGWKTVTTKDRMNNNLSGGAQLFSDRGQWYLSRGWTGDWKTIKANSVPYFDGIRVPQCFDKVPAKALANEKREQKLRKQIAVFVKKLDGLAQLPEPNGGDCWYCRMHTNKGESLGDAFKDCEHLLSHVQEGYLHGSLIYNALKQAGYRNPGFIWRLEDMRRKIGERPDFAKRALRRYLTRKLGLAQ